MPHIAVVTYIGRTVIGWYRLVADLATLLILVVKAVSLEWGRGRIMVQSVKRKQVFFTGVQALGLVTGIAVLTGVLLGALVGLLDASDGTRWFARFLQALLVWLTTATFSPLLIAMVVTARSGTAIAAELALMRITGETDVYESLGINLHHFVIWPRVFGMLVSVVILSVYFNAIGLSTQYLYLLATGATESVQNPFALLAFADIGEAFIKSIILGLGIALISCHFGLSARLAQTTQVPIVTTRAVMTSLIFIFVANLLVSFVSGLFQNFAFSFTAITVIR